MMRYGTCARAIACTVLWLAILCAAAPGSAPAASSVRNATLEQDANADGTPDCWAEKGSGTNTFSFTRTSHAHSGSWAERVHISAFTSGDRELLTRLDGGACAPKVTPATPYRLGAWYRGDAPTRMLVYVRSTAGTWRLWTWGPLVHASSTWRRLTFNTPAIPAETTNLAFGLSLSKAGTLVTDDYMFDEASPPNTVIDSSPGNSVSTAASLAFHATEPSTFECRLDGGKWITCASPRSYSGLSVGSHAFAVRARDAAGNVDPSPATASWTVSSPAVLFTEGFDHAHCSGAVWGTADWASNPCDPPGWHGDASGGDKLYSVADDRPTNVGATQSDTYEQRWWTHAAYAGDVKVEADVKPIGWDSRAPDISSWAGLEFYLHRQADSEESSFYTVDPYQYDGHVYIQKKCWGIIDPDNPLAVDTSSGGTYYLLKQASHLPIAMGKWHHLAGTATDNADGSVTLKVYRDGQLIISATDTAGLTGCAPLRGGRYGWRSDSSIYHIDDFRLNRMP